MFLIPYQKPIHTKYENLTLSINLIKLQIQRYQNDLKQKTTIENEIIQTSKELEQLSINYPDLAIVEEKISNLATSHDNWIKKLTERTILQKEIETTQDRLNQFQNGTCPITNDSCPAVEQQIPSEENLLKKYTNEMESLNAKIQILAKETKELHTNQDLLQKIKLNQVQVKSKEAELLKIREKERTILQNIHLSGFNDISIESVEIELKGLDAEHLSLEKRNNQYY
jgi:DNA repair exonuclease SbcCD ATPase subunit